MIREIIWIVRSLEKLSILFVMPQSITASQTVFILERAPAEFPQFGKKKCLIKFTLPGQIVRKKKDSSIKYYFFWKKVFENITDNNTDLTSALWLTLNFYSLLLSQLPFSYSFESLFPQTNIRDSAVIPAQTFSVSHYVLIFFFRFSAKQSSSSKNPLILEKGPPKITEGGQHGW